MAWWAPPTSAPADRGAGVSWHGGTAPDPVDAAAAEAAPRRGEKAAVRSGRASDPVDAAAAEDATRWGEESAVRSGGRVSDPAEVAAVEVAAAEEPARGGAGAVARSGAAGADTPPRSRAAGANAVAVDRATPSGRVVSRYRNAAPIWTDPAVDEVLPQLESAAVLAAVRSATVGMPVERAACAPFTHGRWAFSHNGAIPNWRETLTALAAKFDSPSLLEAESLTDSAALWVILWGLLETDAIDTSTALRQVATAVLEHSPTARLNLLLSDGETLWATTRYHSLSVLVTDSVAVLSSEPYDDDPRWRAIGDRQLVVAGPGQLTVEPLDIEMGRATS
nr:class II glutamine amidotransferase [Nocardia uniformis]